MLPAEVVLPVAGHIVKEKFVLMVFLQMVGGYTYTYLTDYPFRDLVLSMVVLKFLLVVGGYTYIVDLPFWAVLA